IDTAKVDRPVMEDRRGDDLAFGFKLPGFLAVRSRVQSVQKAIGGTDVKLFVDDNRRGNDGFARAEAPDRPAVADVQGVNVHIERAKIGNVILNERRRGDGALGLETPLDRAGKVQADHVAGFGSEDNTFGGHSGFGADGAASLELPD